MIDYDYEHIFSDNFSTDKTIEILKNIAKKDKNVKIILNSRNFGVFRSSFNAIIRSSGDAIIPMLDADLQDPPELIIDFIKHWNSGFKVVAGKRKDREENIVMRNIRKIYYRIITAIAEFYIPPDVGEYQLLDRDVVNALLKFDDYNPYIRGMIANCGFETKIIKYVQVKRFSGKSKFNLFSYINIFLNGFTSFSQVPMRISIYIGLILAVLSIFYSLYLLLIAFFFDIELSQSRNNDIIGCCFLFFWSYIIVFLVCLVNMLAQFILKLEKDQ